MTTAPLPSFVLHEMTNAVNAVAGVAATLGHHRDRLHPSQLDALIGSLQRQSEMLRQLLGDLGDLAQLEAGAFSVTLQPVRVREVVDAALSQVGVGESVVHLRVPDDIEVLGDRARLEQVVVNLLTNARVHGGPTIWVDATRTGSTATLAVSDDGDGLDVELAESLFEQYRRGPSSGDRPGSGLGLSIVRGITRALGGDVRYVRRPRGSQFLVELEALAPVAVGDAHTPTRAPFDHAAVVWDDPAILEAEIAGLVRDGLDAGDAVIVVATTEHWHGARSRLGDREEELDRALGAGQVVVRDAEALLDVLHDGGQVDPVLFDLHAGGLLAASANGWDEVRVFGEMVSLLWNAGDVVAALDLEANWNALLARHRFGLLCGYQVPPGTELDDAHLAGMCGQHGMVYAG